MAKSRPWAVIPAFNEEKRIREVIRRAAAHAEKIVVVDDGSSDGTFRAASMEGVVVLRHVVNLGKGAALRTGCDYAAGMGAKTIVAIDADGQHNPKDIPRFMEELGKGNDMVFGYRQGLDKMPWIFRLGNSIINRTFRLLFGVRLRDTQGGYRAFTAEAYRKVRWNASDYSMESEMIAKLGKKRMKYSEIPIPTVYHDKYKGTTIKDGIKIILNMIIWRLFR